MKPFFFLALLLAGFASNAQRQQQYLNTIRHKADSLVMAYWGQDNFQKYIRLDTSRSEYLVLPAKNRKDLAYEISHDHEKSYHLYTVRNSYTVFQQAFTKACAFGTQPRFKPNEFLFTYNVFHPAFKNETVTIEFYLNSAGELDSNFAPVGYFQFGLSGVFNCGKFFPFNGGTLDTLKTITKEQAIQIAQNPSNIDFAKRYALNIEECTFTASLLWINHYINNPYISEHGRVNSFSHGHFIWDVKGKFKKGKWQGCSYYNCMNIFIDIFTGLDIGGVLYDDNDGSAQSQSDGNSLF